MAFHISMAEIKNGNKPSLKQTDIAPENRGPLEVWRFLLVSPPFLGANWLLVLGMVDPITTVTIPGSPSSCEMLVTLMVTSPVLLASSWEQVKTIQWGFERFLFWGHWNGMEKDCKFLMIFFKSF